ncbi:MAG: hypothetical protein RL662_1865 [Bacteroidota bacterium]|jgi:hypothetical protein
MNNYLFHIGILSACWFIYILIEDTWKKYKFGEMLQINKSLFMDLAMGLVLGLLLSCLVFL